MKKELLGVYFMFFLLALAAAYAASFSFSPDPNSFVFNLTEHENWIYKLNVTVADALVRYSVEQTNLSLTFNNNTGQINFTPSAIEIGYYSNGVRFFATNRSNALDSIFTTVFFNISNANDAPTILFFSPTTNRSSAENSTLVFNVTATDVDIEYGDNITIEFYLDAVNQTGNISGQIYNGSVSSSRWLNYYAGFCDAGTHNITALVTDLAGNTSRVYWSIVVNNTDRPPAANGTLPGNITWLEDTNRTNNISLGNYFRDPDKEECSGSQKDNLTFTSAGNTNITIVVNNASTNASFYPDPNFASNESVYFTASDGTLGANSSNVTLIVVNVNDGPSIITIANQSIRINTLFWTLINATDPDIPFSNDTLAFSVNDSARFNITKLSTYVANISAQSSSIGNFTVNVTVTDQNSLSASAKINFEFRNNSQPVINTTLIEANATVYFTFWINATDADADAIVFNWSVLSGNISNFNMNSSGFVNFTPNVNETGKHYINISVTDSFVTAWRNVTMNISPFNYPPSLNITDLTGYEATYFTHQLNITDPENDALNITYNFVGANISNFNINTSGYINFTPLRASIGVYDLNITANDSRNFVSRRINFTILWLNHAPNVTSLTPSENLSIAENSSLFFNITALEIDFDVGDNVTIEYYLDSINQTGNFTSQLWSGNNSWRGWTYFSGFCDAGTHNITALVRDWFNQTAQVYWNITVNNTNRPPRFGLKIQSAAVSFPYGSHYRTANVSGNLTLALQNETDYYSFGSFNTSSIDFSSSSIAVNLSYLNWSYLMPGSTNISIQARVSWDASSWSDWSGPIYATGSPFINITPRKYLQLMINLTTNDTTATPRLRELAVGYTIGNYTLQQNTQYSYGSWIDLDDYFVDDDYSECTGSNKGNISYTAVGNSTIRLEIDSSTNRVRFYSSTVVAEDVVFTINDSHGNTSTSNAVNLNVTPYSGGSTSPSTVYVEVGGSSSGSAVIQQVERIRIRNITQPKSFKLLYPGEATIYMNDTLIVPFVLTNSENKTLNRINLSATIGNPNATYYFSIKSFEKLEAGQSVQTNLTVKYFKTLSAYDLLVNATVESPAYQDSAKISISSIMMGEKNRTELNTRLAFTKDLIGSNPECLELNELLLEAEKSIDEFDFQRAKDLIDRTVDDCRYLLSLKGKLLETPRREVSFIDTAISWLTKPVFYAVSISLLVIGALAAYVIRNTIPGKAKKKPAKQKEAKKEEEEEVSSF